jgi:hypothetical protein
MKTCITGKRIYQTQTMAEDALIEANIRFDYASGFGPVGVYKCDDCGLFHLTSQGPVNERLAKAKNEGTLDRQKVAEQWEQKLKKK